MANIIQTNTPSKYNLSFGYNVHSFYDNDEDGFRYVCQVKDATDDSIKGDVRQLPNQVGYAHFDVQNILKNFTRPSYNIEETSKLKTASDECFEYYITYGVLNGTLIQATGNTDNYINFGGRKTYQQIDWDYSPYVCFGKTTLTPLGDGLSVDDKMIAMTDRPPKEITTGSQITDGKPSSLSNTDVVRRYEIMSHQDYTLSFINGVLASAGQTLPSFTNGINGFYIAAYNGSTQVVNTSIDNLTSNGGGADVSLGDEIQPTGEYNGITIQTGIRNSLLSGLDYTHVYICPWAWLNGYSTETQGKAEIGEWYRFDIVDGECNDFDPIEVSWLNSFGFRDYFVFQKRKDHRTMIERNSYQQVNGSWNSTTFGVNSYDRGETIFSQKIEDEYTLNTKYLSDTEMSYLRNLYLSPDVRVRFYGDSGWTPVVMTSNDWEERTFRKNKMFQNTITIKAANKVNSQRG